MSSASLLDNLQPKQFTANLAQAAGTYDLCQASGSDVYVVGMSVYVQTAGATFTSVAIQTNQTTPQVLLSSSDGAVANLTAQKQLFNSIGGWSQSGGPVLLRDGQKIQFTLVGLTGTGTLLVGFIFMPVNRNGTLI